MGEILTIDQLIGELTRLREKVGGSEPVVIVDTGFGENDMMGVLYPVVGNFHDQDGNLFKCAFAGNHFGEEFTREGIPHYQWKPWEDKI